MDKGEPDFYMVPLRSLTYDALEKLSCLLNTTKILFSEGHDKYKEKLPRDWRGLARLINISSEIANSYEGDKTRRVMQYWMQLNDGTATVGKLLEYVQKIDRYDIFDDFMELSANMKLLIKQPMPLRNPPRPNNIVALNHDNQIIPYEEPLEEDIITFDDKIHGFPQFYHAFVMYAYQDKDFVSELLDKMRERGFKMCTEDDLLPATTTTFVPVSRLISSDRCFRIILVYSPEFLESPANKFYMDYAQAVGIEMKKPKIVPCMFRECQLPPQMNFYHKLYYNIPGSKSSYDFWDRLAMSIEKRENAMPRINGALLSHSMNSSSYSGVNITELTSSQSFSSMALPNHNLLALPSPPLKSMSISSLDTFKDETGSTITITSSSSAKKKKPSVFRKVINTLSGKLKPDKMLKAQ